MDIREPGKEQEGSTITYFPYFLYYFLGEFRGKGGTGIVLLLTKMTCECCYPGLDDLTFLAYKRFATLPPIVHSSQKFNWSFPGSFLYLK